MFGTWSLGLRHLPVFMPTRTWAEAQQDKGADSLERGRFYCGRTSDHDVFASDRALPWITAPIYVRVPIGSRALPCPPRDWSWWREDWFEFWGPYPR